jgi:hypothetical protein
MSKSNTASNTENNAASTANSTPDTKVEPPAAAAAQPRVTWDDSKMHSSYANVCNVIGTREEIMLLFGTNQAWHVGQQQVNIALTERVLLNPHAAKRLLLQLEKGIKEYEQRFGDIKA